MLPHHASKCIWNAFGDSLGEFLRPLGGKALVILFHSGRVAALATRDRSIPEMTAPQKSKCGRHLSKVK